MSAAPLPLWRRMVQALAPPMPPPVRLASPRGGRRAYEAAAGGRLGFGWLTNSAGANAEIDAARATLRDRSRDLARNSALATRALSVLAGTLVGEGIRPQPQTGDAELDALLLELWSTLGLDVDVDGRCDVYGLQLLAVGAWLESGESLLRRHWVADGRAVPMQIQVLEPDLIADSLWSPPAPSEGTAEQYGIVWDSDGRRVAYRMYRRHPGESWSQGATTETTLVPASEISHVYRVTRPGQARGVPHLAQIMLDIRDLDDLEHAEIVRQKMQACLAMIRTKAAQDPEAFGNPEHIEVDDDGDYLETLHPGMNVKLPDGEDVKFLSPQQFGGFREATQHYERLIAVGSGVPYARLTDDLSQANYASMRAGELGFRSLIGALCRHTVIPHVCGPMWRWMVDAAIVSGALPPMDARTLARARAPRWHPPRWVAIDREGEVKADVLEIQSGLRTHTQAAAERGEDWRALLAQLAAERDAAEAAGLPLAGLVATSPSQAVTMPDGV